MPNDNLLYLLVADQELNVELDKRIVRRFAPTVVEPKGLAELGSTLFKEGTIVLFIAEGEHSKAVEQLLKSASSGDRKAVDAAEERLRHSEQVGLASGGAQTGLRGPTPRRGDLRHGEAGTWRRPVDGRWGRGGRRGVERRTAGPRQVRRRRSPRARRRPSGLGARRAGPPQAERARAGGARGRARRHRRPAPQGSVVGVDGGGPRRRARAAWTIRARCSVRSRRSSRTSTPTSPRSNNSSRTTPRCSNSRRR